MSEGLRERKMRASRRAMERAAVDIAYEEGVRAVTVDRICEQAMVSRSTFFNYFASLEEAIFGSPLDYDPDLTGRILGEHSDDLVLGASLVVMESVRGQTEDTVTQRRLALFLREPGTTSAVSWASHESREGLVRVIEKWLEAHPEDAKLAEADRAAEARLTVGLSIALGDEVQRHAREVDGEVTIEPETFVVVRRQMAAVATARS
ncbi:TetR/AcrR family transcriptional regulator [Nocardioides jishulii]|uniref:TetR/AcrR family transcriptional regulator n=1 Tax=Nocardioides jishulii TaxID=2575440 RepID=UPI001BAEFBC1|nr:TetR/AcrR family transcriptional regulator [Nocardioides jishulii]